MGRRPQGEAALSGAQRQARYRQRLGKVAAQTLPAVAMRRPPRGPSLSRRWHEAVARLVSLQGDYERWLEATPEATRDGATGEALQAMVDLDLGEIIAIQPPLGFGRD